MTEGLAESAAALNGIQNAVKTAKSLQQGRDALIRIVEETNRQANVLVNLELEADVGDVRECLQRLQEVMKSLAESGTRVLSCAPVCTRMANEVDCTVWTIIKAKGSASAEEVTKLCSQLQKVEDISVKFSKTFDGFLDNLNKAQQQADGFACKLEELAKEWEQKADSRVSTGNWVSAGLFLGGIGLGALGFFTVGLGWVAVAGLAGTGAAGALATQIGTRDSASGLREQARQLSNDASRLADIAKDIQKSCEKAKEIKLNPEVVESIGLALEHYRQEELKDRRIAESELKDRRIAELEAQLRQFRH